jgi:hypothetical protein
MADSYLIPHQHVVSWGLLACGISFRNWLIAWRYAFWMCKIEQDVAAFKNLRIFETSCSPSGTPEDWGLRGCYILSLSELFPTFRRIRLTSSSRIKQSKKSAAWQLDPDPEHLALIQNTWRWSRTPGADPEHLTLIQNTWCWSRTPGADPEHLTLIQNTWRWSRTPDADPEHLALIQNIWILGVLIDYIFSHNGIFEMVILMTPVMSGLKWPVNVRKAYTAVFDTRNFYRRIVFCLVVVS